MSIVKKNITRGIRLKPDSVAFDGNNGELKVDLATSTFRAYLGGASRDILTADQTQIVTNKSIDADTNTITNIDNNEIKAAAGIIYSKLNLTGGIVNADINASAAIDASKIANGTVSNTEFQFLDGVTSAIQTQLGTKADGAASSTDNHLVRFDGTTGKILQDGSTAVLSDAGALTGLTNLQSGNLQLSGNNLISTDTNGNISIIANGTGNIGIGGTPSSARFFDVIGVTTDEVLFRFTETTAGTSSLLTMGEFRATSTGAMADGFGPSFNFVARDTDAVDNLLGVVGFVRSGADNSGALRLQVRNAGVSTSAISANPNGTVGIGANGTSSSYALDVNHPTVEIIPQRLTMATASTNVATEALQLRMISSGDMTDGFGIRQNFVIRDTANTDNTIATMLVARNGADNTGKMAFIVRNAGTEVVQQNITTAGIGIGANVTPVASALLEVRSTTQGALLPSMTTAQRDAISSPASGLLVYNTDTSTYNQYNGSSWVAVGSSQALDTFVALDASESLTGWASGDNATFLGGGILSGTFAKDTTTPLNGAASYKYTQTAGSLDDYIASPVQTVPIRFRGNQATWFFPYTYNGNSTDIEPILWDVTNAVRLTTSTNLLPSTPTTGSLYKVNVTIPSTCTQIRVGFQVKALNSGKILAFDDLQVSADTTKYADPSTITDWQSYTPTFTGFGTATSIETQWRRNGSNVEIRGKFVSGTTTATEARISLPNSYSSAGTTIIPSIQHIGSFANTTNVSYFGTVLIEPAVSYVTFGLSGTTNNGLVKQNGSALFSNGTSVSIQASIPIAGLSASNPQIIAASDSFSTDTASLTYASSATYTISTLTDAPVGTFITYSKSTTNTLTQTTTAPTQSTSDMNTNGISTLLQVTGTSVAAATPGAWAFQIGKGLKGVTLNVYKSTSKTTGGDSQGVNNTAAAAQGVPFSYNEKTGVLFLTTCNSQNSTITSWAVGFEDGVAVTAGTAVYVTINASKSPALVGVPQVQPRFATITDVKASGTAGGASSAATQNTRTLNTLVDSTGIVTSLSSNQFVLSAGTYYIDASAPAFKVSSHKIRLRNITAGSTSIIGSSAYCESTDNTSTHSFLSGEVVITVATTFELQHYTQAAQATNGLGVANTTGESEIYATVKITKVK